jgi:hypothetical protein
MTRAELVKFLTENYEPDEQLVWQTMCFSDVESADGATPQLWTEFVDFQDRKGYLAGQFSEACFEEFYDFVDGRVM